MYNNLNRRKRQRNITKIFNKANNMLKEDSFWRGRFVINQIDNQWHQFSDHSGAYMIMDYEIVDKKTGYAKLYHQTESIFWESNLWWNINDFIVNKIDVWENESPYEETQDWNEVYVEPWSMRQWKQIAKPYSTLVRRETVVKCQT